MAEPSLLPGDRLLAHTDGVNEARDAAGDFYPLAARVPVPADDPAGLVAALCVGASRPSPGAARATTWRC
ncbi:SpoIIE family protein phosphatase [Streptomyces sp. NPDC058290]|uniref:SpoIIE family protein phosphatase n=1 Tax=Streptomyces sp. NPDC058290 TaxID=3346426 RepID=UPI0036E7953E